MGRKYVVFLTIIGLLVLLGFFFFIVGGISKYTGYVIVKEDSHACLQQQDILLFVDSEPIVLTDERVMQYVDDVNIIVCDDKNQICSENDIISFPTWIIGKKKIVKDITFFELEWLSGCVLR